MALAQRNVTQATKDLADAVRLAEARFGPEDPRRGLAYGAMAELLRIVDRPAEASAWYEKAEPLFMQHFRRRPADCFDSLHNWAICLMELNRLNEAEQRLLQALALLTPSQRWENVLARHSLGRLALDAGEWDKAASAFQEARDLLQGVRHSTKDLLVQRLAAGEAQLLVSQDRVEEAFALLQSRCPNPDDHFTRLIKADILRRLGKLTLAEEEAREALARHEAQALPNHSDGIAYWTVLALSLAGLGGITEAEELFHRALDAQEKAGLPDTFASAEMLDAYAALLRSSGCEEQAMSLAERARQARLSTSRPSLRHSRQ
jgi:tetratricopeptide (TPR) repeat protein